MPKGRQPDRLSSNPAGAVEHLQRPSATPLPEQRIEHSPLPSYRLIPIVEDQMVEIG
jgi:hypothetical protein